MNFDQDTVETIVEAVQAKTYLTRDEYERLPEWLRRQLDRRLARIRRT